MTRIGNKSTQLLRLRELGFPIPRLLVFDVHDFQDNGPGVLQKIKDEFAQEKVIVRSSMGGEDAQTSSCAGMFTSVSAQGSKEIYDAINTVIQDARSKKIMDDDIHFFVQKYITSKLSGVAFSIDPNDTHSMYIEYTKNVSDLVQGNVTPSQVHLSFYKKNILWRTWKKELHSIVLEIQKTLGKPQDIEWLWDGRQIHIVQSRPITTLGEKAIQIHQEAQQYFIEHPTCTHIKYHGVNETITHATPGIEHIVRDLYAPDSFGKALEKLGGSYLGNNHILSFGGFFYIDEQMEKCNVVYPKFSSKIYTRHALEHIQMELATTIGEARKHSDATDVSKKDVFIQDIYQIVHTINILTHIFSKKYHFFLKNVGNQGSIATSKVSPDLWDILHDTSLTNMIGNSFDPSDTSAFQIHLPTISSSTKNLSYFDEIRETFRMLQFLRDITRCIDVCFRKYLIGIGYEQVALRNSKEAIPLDLFRYPQRTMHKKIDTLSPGMAQGYFSEDPQTAEILYSSHLHISLFPYLHSLKGIVCHTGGTLSHLAILCREKNIPVIAGVQRREIVSLLEKQVVLDSSEDSNGCLQTK